ncbi:PhoU domain-containing protein [Spiroplasma endosymbiont of Aspidapion aeneum]|uniref:PhoU domain-containing protein n=1 Tax=Spiroplasma endosymbiont of Aspidapion aeneum TaxID=3066276 RepID=UPI00313ACFB6
MSFNKILDKDVKQIRNFLVDLVEDTKNQYAQTFGIVKSAKFDGIDEILANDKKINDKQNNFTKMALWKIVKQKMVASDLRLAVGGIIISREIKKTAHVAKRICKNLKIASTENYLPNFEKDYEYFQYVVKMFEIANTILNLTGNLIENFVEDQHKKVLIMEKSMKYEIREIMNGISLSKNKVNTVDSAGFLLIIRQLKDLEKAAESLLQIEETLQFIRTGSFEELDIYKEEK